MKCTKHRYAAGRDSARRDGRAAALEGLRAAGVVGVVRVDSAAAARQAAAAYIRGGLGCVEITMTTPDATTIITELADRYREDPAVLVGAGTVLTRDQARAALDAGARYLVAPSRRISPTWRASMARRRCSAR